MPSRLVHPRQRGSSVAWKHERWTVEGGRTPRADFKTAFRPGAARAGEDGQRDTDAEVLLRHTVAGTRLRSMRLDAAIARQSHPMPLRTTRNSVISSVDVGERLPLLNAGSSAVLLLVNVLDEPLLLVQRRHHLRTRLCLVFALRPPPLLQDRIARSKIVTAEVPSAVGRVETDMRPSPA